MRSAVNAGARQTEVNRRREPVMVGQGGRKEERQQADAATARFSAS